MTSIIEVVRLIIVTFAIGYIFSGFIKISKPYFNFEDFKLSILIAAPAVILHELAHKFVALLLGLKATFFAYYPGLIIGVILKLINSPILILVPGYVSISNTNALYSAITAFAGPFTNLLIWISAVLILKRKYLSNRQILILTLTKRINIFLFFFNMIPFGPFDGAKVFSNLIKIL